MNSHTENTENMAQRNREIAQMPNIRIFYHKKGASKYISHLDITRCMQRALKRAEIPVWYTQGFNPHMYLTFALPLALGYESECECMDLRLTEPIDLLEIKERLGRSLPEGITVINAAPQKNKPQDICYAEYEIIFYCENADEISRQFEQFCNQKEIIVLKRTKKGHKQVDLKPEFSLLENEAHRSRGCGVSVPCATRDISFPSTKISGRELGPASRWNESFPDYVRLRMLFTAGQKNINPTLLITPFLESIENTEITVSILRKQIYLKDMIPFE